MKIDEAIKVLEDIDTGKRRVIDVQTFGEIAAKLREAEKIIAHLLSPGAPTQLSRRAEKWLNE